MRLAIDDFGTGYSSLSYLRQFPFDILKIDHSFIASMADSAEAATMVRTMIELGRRLKLEVIAEGVENEQQLDLLRRLHCHFVQGYHFWRPIDAEAMTSLLTEWPSPGTLEPQGGSPTISRRARLRRSSSAAVPATEMPNKVSTLPGESSEPHQRPERAPARPAGHEVRDLA